MMSSSPRPPPRLTRRPLRHQQREQGIQPTSQTSENMSKKREDNSSDESEEECQITDDETSTKSSQYKKIYPQLHHEELDQDYSVVPKTCKHDKKCEHASFGISLLVFYILCSVVFLAVLYLFVPKRHNSSLPENTMAAFTTELRNIEKRFVHQPRKTWHVINATTKYVISTTTSQQPAVVLFLAASESNSVAPCLAHFLAQAIGRTFRQTKYPVIKATALSRSDAVSAKKRIDDIFREQFDENRRGVIVLEDVDHLPGEAAMMLHSLCDDTNAKYKQTAILLTATAKHGGNVDDTQSDKMAIVHLNAVWKDSLTEDFRGGLISRLTGGVVVTLPEEMPNECQDRTCPLFSQEFCELGIVL